MDGLKVDLHFCGPHRDGHWTRSGLVAIVVNNHSHHFTDARLSRHPIKFKRTSVCRPHQHTIHKEFDRVHRTICIIGIDRKRDRRSQRGVGKR